MSEAVGDAKIERDDGDGDRRALVERIVLAMRAVIDGAAPFGDDERARDGNGRASARRT